MSRLTNITKCHACSSEDIQWHSGTQVINCVVQGRLNSHDVQPIFFLGCNNCSETLKVVSGERVAQYLNQKQD